MPRRLPKIDIGRVFHALDDATRREILERISKGPVSVSELAEPMLMSLAAVVQHLQVLEDRSLIHTEKVGRVRTCRMEPAGLAAAEQWIHERRAVWERKLDRLGDVSGASDE